MEKLTKYEIQEEIIRLNDAGITANPKDVLDVYNKLQSESNIQKYSKKQLYELINDIQYGLHHNETKESIYINQGSQKHLNYFDNFLQEGETSNVIKALKDNNISLDVLRGIKPYRTQDFNSPIDTNIRIEQIWSDSQEESPTCVGFYIYYKGKLIYKWTNDATTTNIENSNITFEELVEKAYNQKLDYKIGKTLIREEVETPDYKYTVQGYKTSSGKVAKRRQYAAGTIINGINVGGRFF